MMICIGDPKLGNFRNWVDAAVAEGGKRYLIIAAPDRNQGTIRSMMNVGEYGPIIIGNVQFGLRYPDQLPSLLGEYSGLYIDGKMGSSMVHRVITLLAGALAFTKPEETMAPERSTATMPDHLVWWQRTVEGMPDNTAGYIRPSSIVVATDRTVFVAKEDPVSSHEGDTFIIHIAKVRGKYSITVPRSYTKPWRVIEKPMFCELMAVSSVEVKQR